MNFLRAFLVLLHLTSVGSSEFSLTIDEKSSIDHRIFRFPHSYELVTNFQSTFNLTNNQQDLILMKPIDRDQWCSMNLCSCQTCSVLLQLFSNENQSAKFSTINITIKDINDHSPQFLDVQQRILLSESLPVGHRFLVSRVVDLDSGFNGRISFELRQSADYFDLETVSLSNNEYALYALLKRSLDRETSDKYSLIISAQDHGYPQVKSNETEIQIEIVDENDNSPKFNQTEYSIQSLPENTTVGTEILRVLATDLDKDHNGLIEYSIVHSMNISDFPFSIDARSGSIRLERRLNFERTRFYRFLIRASDSGLPKSLFTDSWLSISVDDSNRSPIEILFVPHRRFRFDNQTLFIEENVNAENLTLGYFRLFDHQTVKTNLSLSLILSEQIQRQDYRLVPSDQQNTFLFQVAAGFFDREVQQDISLRFMAKHRQLTSIYHLKIRLIDLNDNPSEFHSSVIRFYVEELPNYQMIRNPTANNEIVLGYLNSTDRDEGINAENIYVVEPNDWLRIDSETGRMVLFQPLDREQISKIELKAKAINVAEPKWETEVKIEIFVLDVNDNTPKCLTMNNRLSIPENYPVEKSIFKIESVDGDEGLNGSIVYSIRSNSSWPFVIDRRTGEIYSRTVFDYESKWKHFTLTIDLEDEGTPRKQKRTSACQLELIVDDINDNPPKLNDDQQKQIFFDVKNLNGSLTIPLNVSDEDSGPNGKIKFTLQSIESTIPIDSNQTIGQIDQNGILQINYLFTQITLLKLKILLEDYGYPQQENLLSISIALGDRTNPKYSTFDQVSNYFEEQRSQTNPFAFLFGLTILILTLICFTSIIIICLLMRQHNRRHKSSMMARKQLLCSSSQQLTNSASTVTSNTTTLSIEHQQIHRSLYWNEKRSSLDQQSIDASSSPQSYTYTILHIPKQRENDKNDAISCDHGYQGSYQTGSPSSISTEPFSSQISIHRNSMINQLPDFVTKCRSLTDGFILEMNVDGSDEENKECN